MRISDWSSDVCSSDLERAKETVAKRIEVGAPVPAARFEQQRKNEATRIAREDLTLRQQERKPSRSRYVHGTCFLAKGNRTMNIPRPDPVPARGVSDLDRNNETLLRVIHSSKLAWSDLSEVGKQIGRA